MPGINFYIILLFFLGNMFLGNAQEDGIQDELKNLSGQSYFVKANEVAEYYFHNDTSKCLDFIEDVINNPEIEAFPAEKVKAHNIKISALIVKGNYDLAEAVYLQNILLAQENNNRNLLAETYVSGALVYSRKGEFGKAQEQIGLALSSKTLEEVTLAKTYYVSGTIQNAIDSLDIAKEHFEKSMELYNKIGDQKGESDVIYRMAVLHLVGFKDEEKALGYFTEGKEIKEQIGDDKGLANYNLSLGILHEEKGNYQYALDYYEKSLFGYQKLSDKANIAKVYNNIGVAYVDWKKYDSAQVYHERSAKMHLELKNPLGIIRSQSNLAEVFSFQGRFNEALKHYHNALSKSKSAERNPMYGSINNSLGDVFLKMGQLDSARYYLNESLRSHKENNNYFSQRHTYKNLSLLEEKSNDFETSLRHFKTYKQIQDSLFATRKTRELAEIQAKYDTAKQEKEISELQQENRSRKLWQNIYAVGGILALVLTVVLFQFFRFRNKKNQELLALKETQRQQLEEVNQLKTRFFHNISHEFRTPLTLILGPLEQLKNNVGTSIQPTVDMIERNGKRLLKLINQLLDLSKIEEGKISLKAAYTDIVPLLKGWVTSFHSMAEIKGIDLSLDLRKESHFVYIDQTKLEEVIVNLLSNALKYTPAGGRVSLQVDETDKSLNIVVSDTGNGIPKEELEYIFNRFYQASNTTSENQIGTGIGLALVKELVELHKGTITVESEVGKGSNFKIILPLGKEHLSIDDIVTIAPTPKTIPKQVLLDALTEEETIENEDAEFPILLLIEDNTDLRTYIKSILNHQYVIKEAIDGKQGIEVALELIPDIIISDLMMPKVHGLEVCKTLKEDVRTSHIPIILLTARSSEEDKIEGLKSLADDYLTKPFNNQELLVRIENLVAIRNKMQRHFSTGDILKPKKVILNSVDQDFIKKVTEVLETEIANENFGVVELAEAVALSRSQLFRKIKAITSLTPNEFIRSFRLHRAMDMLEQQSGTIAEIAYSVGFQNPSYFSKCFQEQFGALPSDIS